MSEKMYGFFNPIEAYCNAELAYEFNESVQQQWESAVTIENQNRVIGHMLKCKFRSIDQDLKADLVLSDPMNPQTKTAVVAVIHQVSTSYKPMRFQIRIVVSPQNRAILKEALLFSALPELEISCTIYEFDYAKKRYFKRFFTLEQPLIVEIADKIYFEDEPYYRITRSINFLVVIDVQGKDIDQYMGLSCRADGTQFKMKCSEKEESFSENFEREITLFTSPEV